MEETKKFIHKSTSLSYLLKEKIRNESTKVQTVSKVNKIFERKNAKSLIKYKSHIRGI